MSTSIKQLIKVLEESEKAYQLLLPVFDKEKEAAFNSEPDTFSAVVEEKEELLARLRQIDQRRMAIIHQISSAWDIPVYELRLSCLADRVEGLESSQIKRLQVSLRELMEKVKRCNEENRRLIQHCLDLVQGTLGFFQHWVMPKDVYGASGQINMHQRSGSLISGAV
jgi:flagellar biosynthesis/type III secretory pathway chaperone